MTQNEELKRSIVKSRLIAGLLLIVSAAAFLFAYQTAQQSTDQQVQLAAKPQQVSPQADGEPSLEKVDALLSQLARMLTPADVMAADFYALFPPITQELQAINLPEAQQLGEQIALLTSLEPRLIVFRVEAEKTIAEINGLTKASGAPFRDANAKTMPAYQLMAQSLAGLNAAYKEIGAKRPLANIKDFQGHFKDFLIARDQLLAYKKGPIPEKTHKTNLTKLQATNLAKNASERESSLMMAGASLDEIRRLSTALRDATAARQASAAAQVQSIAPTPVDHVLLIRVAIALGVLSLLGSVFVVLSADRAVLTHLGEPSPSSSKAHVVSEDLAYLQLVTKQTLEIGRQINTALRKLVRQSTEIEQANLGDQDLKRAACITELDQRIGEIQKAMLQAKERGIQLSLALTQASSVSGDSQITETSDQLFEQIEHLESVVARFNKEFLESLSQAIAPSQDQSAMSEKIADFRRDTEGLLVAANQWIRQFERLHQAIEEISGNVAQPEANLSGRAEPEIGTGENTASGPRGVA